MSAAPSVLLLHGVQSSHTTWWQAAADLGELGWRVTALDLVGHGGRSGRDTALGWIDDLAADVLTQCTDPGPYDLVVGHSLGAVVALAAAAREPGLARGVLIEDPPGLGRGGVDVQVVADEIERDVAAARRDPAARVEALLADNPLWSRGDAQQSVANCLGLDADAVVSSLRASHWDLPALVRACPRPVQLLAAPAATSTVTGADRQALLALLPAERVTVVRSGHGIHRDRPALWLHTVLGFAEILA